MLMPSRSAPRSIRVASSPLRWSCASFPGPPEHRTGPAAGESDCWVPAGDELVQVAVRQGSQRRPVVQAQIKAVQDLRPLVLPNFAQPGCGPRRSVLERVLAREHLRGRHLHRANVLRRLPHDRVDAGVKVIKAEWLGQRWEAEFDHLHVGIWVGRDQ